MEGVGQDHRNDIVIHLPESADGQEGQTYQKSSLIIQFHCDIPFWLTNYILHSFRLIEKNPFAGFSGSFVFQVVDYILSGNDSHQDVLVVSNRYKVL